MGARVWMPVRICRLGSARRGWFGTAQGGLHPHPRHRGQARVPPRHMALCPHTPKGTHPSAVPGWRGMLLNQDIQKLLLQAGTSQTPFHKLLQAQRYRTSPSCRLTFMLCPSYSVCVFQRTQQSEAAIHRANACKNMHSDLHPLGAKPWQTRASSQT